MEPNKKQTAVEWLIEELFKKIDYTQVPQKLIDQAKQMEKEQIMKAVDRGFDEGCKFPEDISLNNAEQYYNETYKGGK
jgi:hypothetical protein